MAKQDNKVGSDRKAARKFAGKGDFGIPADASRRDPKLPQMDPAVPERPAGAKLTDTDGLRIHGVGGDPDSGPGASSGGDLDTDIIGLDGSGGGVAQSGTIGNTEGPDITAAGATDPDTVKPTRRHPKTGRNRNKANGDQSSSPR